MKLKKPHLTKTLGTIIQENYWTFYPSEPFRMLHFEMRYPVWHVCKFQLSLCFFLLRMRRQGRRKWVWQGWQLPTQLLSDEKQKEIHLLLTLVELLIGCPPRFKMLPTHLCDNYVQQWWVKLVIYYQIQSSLSYLQKIAKSFSKFLFFPFSELSFIW